MTKLGSISCFGSDRLRLLRRLAAGALVLFLAARPGRGNEESYRLGIGDIVEVRVEGEASLSGTYKISEEGSILFPLLGVIPARGRSVPELTEHLRTALGRDYLKSPQLAVSVASYASQKVLVLGEVATPGFVLLRQGSSLLGVLTEAGLKGQDPDTQIVVVKGRSGGDGSGSENGPAPIVFRMKDLLDPTNAPPQVALADGDRILVQSATVGKVLVLGEVTSPGFVPLRADSSLMGVLTQTGLKGQEPETQIVVVKGQEGEAATGSESVPAPVIFRMKDLLDPTNAPPQIELADGDRIFVRLGSGGQVIVSGKVKSPGVIPLREKMTVLEAINRAGGLEEFGNAKGVRVVRERADGKSDVIKVNVSDVTDGDRAQNVELKDGDIIVVPRRWL